MADKFTRVTLDRELRSNSDGMPVFRNCFEHETLMSFWDDDGNYAFQEWWNEEGATQFMNYCKSKEEWKHLEDWCDD